MAGTIDIFERCYPGLEIREGALWLNPVLPDELTKISFQVNYRGHLLTVEIDHDVVTIESPESPSSPVFVQISGERLTVAPGEKVVHLLSKGAGSSVQSPAHPKSG